MDKTDIAVGDLVRHPTYGIGRVLALGADSRMTPITARFDLYGTRQVSTDNLSAYESGDLIGMAL